MNRHKKTYEINLHGMLGYGETRGAAKQDAQQKLTRAMTGDYQPWYFAADQHLLIVWRQPPGWRYKIVWPDSPDSGRLFGYDQGDSSFEEIQHTAVCHLARMLYQDTATIPKVLADLLGETALRDHAEYCQWQRRYAEAVQRGLSDDAAREFASGSRVQVPSAAFPTEPRAPMQSFKAEFIADNSGQCYGNEPRFATRPEAEGYATSLSWRWILVRDHRVIESEDPVNAKFVNGRSVPLAPPEARSESPSRDCPS